MIKKTNTADVKKLQAEISKLKLQISTVDNKLKTTTQALKEQKSNFKTEFATKMNSALKDAFTKARADAEKRLRARDKVIADAVTKFEKEWDKTQKHASSKKSVTKKTSSKKTTKKNRRTAGAHSTTE